MVAAATRSGRAGHMRWLRLACVWLALLMCSVPGRGGWAQDKKAQDKPRIAIGEFEGRGARRIRRDVMRALSGAIDMVPPRAFARVRKKLGITVMDDSAVVVLAREFEAHGVLSGVISRRRGRYRLILAVRAASDGAVIKEFKVVLGRRLRVGSHARRRMRRELEPALVALMTSAPAPAGDSEAVAEDTADTDSKEDATGSAATGSEAAAGGSPALQRGAQPEGRASATRAAAPRLLDREPVVRPGFDLIAGASMLGRRLTFAAREGLDNTPFEYRGMPVPGARVRAELHPVALFGGTGLFSGLGASFEFERAVAISSRVEGLATEIPTTHQRWHAGMHYRLDLGRAANAWAFTVGGGYGEREFVFDRSVLVDTTLEIDVPDVMYRVYDPGLAMRIPLGSRVALHTRGAYLIVRDAGGIESPESYGAATADGIDAEVRATIWLSSWLVMHMGAQYTRIAFAFDGQGAQSDRDGDGMVDVDSAVDQYFGGYMTTGVQF